MQAQGNEKTRKRSTTGISERHSRSCRSHDGGKCNCTPSIRAFVYDRKTGAKVRKTFTGPGATTAAKRWRTDASSQQNNGKAITPSRLTFRQAAEQWLEGAKAEPPTILNRSKEPFKPSALREYERNLKNHLLDDFGAHRLDEIRRGDLQHFIDRLVGKGLSGSKIRNIIIPVRVIYRHALQRDIVSVNPTTYLQMPKPSQPRERAADATEAAALLGALPADDQALWATAFYAGLRRGELQALQFDDIDLATGIIHVHRAWDEVAGMIEPKSAKGVRTVPIIAILRDYLDQRKANTGRSGSQFVFGSKPDRPFVPRQVRDHANKAWGAENAKRAKKKQKLDPLVPIMLHECRHTFVSLMYDAGFSLEQIGPYVGHSSAYMTERYAHLLRGHEDRTRQRLDDYFALADTARRVSQLGKKT